LDINVRFQLVDDVLDFEGSEATLGKPALADLRLGLATAPTLLAAEEHPQLAVLIARKFAQPGDVDRAIDLVRDSDGVRRAKDLAVVQTELAFHSLSRLPDSEARDSLKALAIKAATRHH
jgi:geranylgeranyl pyrophosphate synthase